MVFNKLSDFETTYSDCRIANWRSDRTGLRVVLVKKQTPIVNGYFAVASEINDDSGCPHTLEHLVFMGSREHPYKGLLDTVGNLVFSETNASTDTDQTVYTLTSAGWEGFKTLLPVYLDHVLYPTLTDDACLTEVYHIDGHGEEKGVVFSEMQGVENTSMSLISLKLRQLMYSKESGFASETGGLMESLRVLTSDQIREFHKLRYKPDNLCVVIAGDVDPDDLIQVMEEFDGKIDDYEPTKHRPFVDSPQDLPPAKSIVETIEFPELDESYAEAEMGFMGPHGNDVVLSLAMDVLGSYLTRQGVGKLSLELTEVADPLAAEIFYFTYEFLKVQMALGFSGVPVEKLDELQNAVNRALERQVEEFDFQAIQDCLQRKRQRYLLQTEQDTQVFVDIAVADFIFGNDHGKDLEKFLKDLREFDELASWSKEKWVEVYKQYFVNNSSVTVLGQPSAKLYHQMNEEKEQRLKQTQEKYGKEGLEKLQARLDEAQVANNLPIPEKVLDGFSTPSSESISLIKTTTAKAGTEAPVNDSSVQQKVTEDTPKDFPLSMHFEHYSSQFVTLQVLMSSFEVDEKLVPYIEVIFRDLFSLPMCVDGVNMSFETVVEENQRDTLESGISGGRSMKEMVAINVKTKIENYDKGIEWIRRAMYDSVFDKERISVLVDKHLSSLAEEKRNGSAILESSMVREHFTSRSFKVGGDLIATEEFYKQVEDTLDTGFDKIKQDLEKIRTQLFKPENMRVLVHGNILDLAHPVSAWQPITGDVPPKELIPLARSFNVLTQQGKDLKLDAHITPMPATESSFLSLIGHAPTDYHHPDDAAIELCCEYLQAVEGPLWRAVRGTGLAYGASFYRDTESGQLMLDVYRGADAAQAVQVTAKLVEDLASGTVEFDKRAVQAAVSACALFMAQRQVNAAMAASSKYVDEVLRGRGADYTERMIKQLQLVSVEDLQRVMKEYMLPLFRAETSTVFVTCHPSMVDHLDKVFVGRGYKVQVHPLIADESDDDDEESGDEEEEEEDEDDDDDE